MPEGVRLTLTGQVWRWKQIDERKSWELRCSTLQGLSTSTYSLTRTGIRLQSSHASSSPSWRPLPRTITAR
jgi:hypothetical protein